MKRLVIPVALMFMATAVLCGCARQCGPWLGAAQADDDGAKSGTKKGKKLAVGATHGGLGGTSRFGIDYVFPHQAKSREERWAETVSATGAGWVNFHDIRWDRIERRAPSGGRHDYRWDDLFHDNPTGRSCERRFAAGSTVAIVLDTTSVVFAPGAESKQ